MGCEETRLGAFWTDSKCDTADAAGAISHVGSTTLVNVDPRIDAATGEMDTDVSAALPREGPISILTVRIARQIKVIA